MSGPQAWEGVADDVTSAIEKAVQPLLEKAVHDIYCGLLETTQDYLKDNIAFNIASRINASEHQARYDREENRALRLSNERLHLALVGLTDIMNRAESNASGNPEWEAVSKRIIAARAAISKAVA